MNCTNRKWISRSRNHGFSHSEKRLKEEKDRIVREKDTIIKGLQDKLNIQRLTIEGFQSEMTRKLAEARMDCLQEKKDLVNKIIEFAKSQSL